MYTYLHGTSTKQLKKMFFSGGSQRKGGREGGRKGGRKEGMKEERMKERVYREGTGDSSTSTHTVCKQAVNKESRTGHLEKDKETMQLCFQQIELAGSCACAVCVYTYSSGVSFSHLLMKGITVLVVSWGEREKHHNRSPKLMIS